MESTENQRYVDMQRTAVVVNSCTEHKFKKKSFIIAAALTAG